MVGHSSGAMVTETPTLQEERLDHRLHAMDVCEVFPTPRAGPEAVKLGLKAGDAMGFTPGRDLNRDDDRIRAEEYIDKEKPLVNIASLPCVASSQLQILVQESERKGDQLALANSNIEI